MSQQKQDFSFRGPIGLCIGQAPHIPSELFIGRTSEFDMMADILQPGKKFPEQRRLVLGGMGGIGKTQLAIAYAERHRKFYDSVFWFNAASEAVLKESFQSIANLIFDIQEPGVLEGKDTVIRIHQWLSDAKNTGWLLVFDNYDDPSEFKIDLYFPPASHGAIITTTRRPDLVAGSVVQIKPFENIEESLAVLQTRSKRENIQSGMPRTNTYRIH